ncbi:hypothetical protein LUZ60_009753 [Juncus effusus]|nr:hypothetical protein LUZ60_009753 [Juncus effusus]
MVYSSYFSLHLYLLSLTYLLLCLSNNVSCTEEPTAEMHEKWMANFNKVYDTRTEKEIRFKIFSENVKYINEFNKAKNHTYTLAINQFTDLTTAEFVALVGRGRMRDEGSRRYVSLTDGEAAPDSIDWRAKGVVTPIKNQYPCGSCWAFAPVAAIESLINIKTGQMTSLSEQEIIDCVPDTSTCKGGFATDSFNFVISNEGITTEADYPYTATRMTCNADKLPHKTASISGVEYVPMNDENQLMLRVARQPVVAFVISSGIRHYGGGIFSGDCGEAFDHYFTLIGYGQDENGVKYWIAKNSWGATWGDEGYVYLAKDVSSKGGTCGLATSPMFPVY